MPKSSEGKPEGAAGRERERVESPQRAPGAVPARSGAAIRREEGDESEFAGEIRERERDEPPTERDVE
jgi:hypothetical protein